MNAMEKVANNYAELKKLCGLNFNLTKTEVNLVMFAVEQCGDTVQGALTKVLLRRNADKAESKMTPEKIEMEAELRKGMLPTCYGVSPYAVVSVYRKGKIYKGLTRICQAFGIEKEAVLAYKKKHPKMPYQYIFDNWERLTASEPQKKKKAV